MKLCFRKYEHSSRQTDRQTGKPQSDRQIYGRFFYVAGQHSHIGTSQEIWISFCLDHALKRLLRIIHTQKYLADGLGARVSFRIQNSQSNASIRVYFQIPKLDVISQYAQLCHQPGVLVKETKKKQSFYPIYWRHPSSSLSSITSSKHTILVSC